jgi:hypothetical protein
LDLDFAGVVVNVIQGGHAAVISNRLFLFTGENFGCFRENLRVNGLLSFLTIIDD